MSVHLENYGFAALQKADHYRAALLTEFAPYLAGHVLEVGAGIGQLSEALLRNERITRFVSVEPDARFANRLRDKFPQLELIQGTIDDVPAALPVDTILSVNVLEHIEADGRELANYRQRLAARRGMLCLFVPARPELFTAIDRDFGHFRRYTRAGLRARLVAAGFIVQRLVYFNLLGYFGWWWNFRLLKKRSFAEKQVQFFDRTIFPLQHCFEARVLRPPFGMSLLALAEAT